MASVLIVDDDVDGMEPPTLFLRQAGHKVDCLPNGREALAALVHRTPDVVILDLRMPVMDGIAFLEVVRSYHRWQTLPVIVLSGSDDMPQLHRATELGVVKVYQKPGYQLIDLLRAVNEATQPRTC